MTFFTFIHTLLKVSRPRFWLYTAGPFVLGVLSSSSAQSLESFEWFWVVFFACVYLLLGNFFLYGINDIYDQETDKWSTKKSGYELSSLDEKKTGVQTAVWISLVLLCLCGVLLPLAAMFAHILFIFLSAAYSAPPFRFKARPFFDSYSNILYVVPGLVGYWLWGDVAVPSVWVVMAGVSWVAGMHAFSAIPDINADTKAGITTSAVYLGVYKAYLFCLINWMMSAVAMSELIPTLSLLFVVYPLICLFCIVKKYSQAELTQLYWWFPVLNSVVGGCLFFWLLLF